ncbi:TonB-dependent receptor [beta proteobacterium KB13]|uniref:TonB-dependent receptor n=1 Tax=beta proteobacterium KB13 TaxID=314607 RepID=B6BTE5_9PROT|nr:TonB-dependent receptor [beta proteobacterium KB13]
MRVTKTKLSLAVLSALANTAYAEDLETSKINVYSPAPLPSIGLDQSIVPGSITVIQPQDVQQQSGVSLADYLNNNVQGISFNEVGGNPWQPEVFYRGYSAGSIAGNPQGLSIYVDGVRENQPFSDVVLWDTIPTWALSGAQVVGGSNPIYGLNTLGGAISMQTKNGKLFNKGVISATAGSWDRTAGLIEMGGIIDGTNIDYYFGYNHTSENGWRDHSPSHLNQAFGKIGMDLETGGRVELSYTGASNNLIGNGLAPKYLLGADNSGVNTVPDATENRYNKFNLAYTDLISDTVMLSANAYYIQSNRYTLNGDAEIEFDGDEFTNSGYSSINGRYMVNQGDDIDEIEAETRTTKTKQDKYGINAQLTFTDDLFGYKNHLVTGVNFETSLIGFVQNEYEGSSFIGNSRLIDTTTGEYENNSDLQGRTKTAGIYAVDTLSLNDQWHVTGGLRYNYTEIDNKDRRADQSAGSLTEKASYARINPTIGVTYKPTENYQTYASYSESNRAPTSIELGCSNPAIACSLPTQMADDPPLDDIVSKTYEAGASGRLTGDLKWNAAIYHAMNHDDIHFINNNAQNGLGYFDNVGRTRRDGIDVGVSGSGLFGMDLFGQGNKFSWSGSYGYVNATYDSDLRLVSDANTSRTVTTNSYNSYDDDALVDDDTDFASEVAVALYDLYDGTGLETDYNTANGVGAYDALNIETDADDADDWAEFVEDNIGIETSAIDVKRGDQLANIPQHRLKLRMNYNPAPNVRMGLTALGYGKSYMMGNENQKHQGDGENPGYFLLNADMSWSPAKNWMVSLKAINLLDKNYYNGGRLLMNGFTGVGNTARSEVFRGVGVIPGSPQAAWITVGYSFK